MNPLLNSLHFTRVGIASSAYTLLAAANQDDELSQACEALAGTDFYAEAFLTQSSRDAALGQVPGHLEFVPASAAEVVAAEYPLEKLAIGPGLLSPEFGQVSSIILPAVLESELDCCSGSELHLDVTVNRVQYLITMNRDGQMQSTVAIRYISKNLKRNTGAPPVGWLIILSQASPPGIPLGEVGSGTFGE
jgi:hypothetical protein